MHQINERFLEDRRQAFDEAVGSGDHVTALKQIDLLKREGFSSEAADLEKDLLFSVDDSWDY